MTVPLAWHKAFFSKGCSDTATAPQAITPTPMHADMQSVPLDHNPVACGGLGSGKSFGGELVVARDSTVLKEMFNCLIVRRSYAGLQNLSNSIGRTLSALGRGLEVW